MKTPKINRILFTVGLLLLSVKSGLNLFCHQCGEFDSLSGNFEGCQDFEPVNNSTLVECEEGSEACVTYTRHLQQESGSVRGCRPVNGSVPGPAGVTVNSKVHCQLLPGDTHPVTMCTEPCQLLPGDTNPVTMCTCNQDGCNGLAQLVQSPRTPKQAELFDDDESIAEEDDEQEGIINAGLAQLAQLPRTPKQAELFDDDESIADEDDEQGIINADSIEFGQRISSLPRAGKQRRVQCYSCGSLYRSEAPNCPRFDPNNATQRTSCAPGEACLLYMWKKSRTQIGSFRECFSTSIPLGHPDYPIKAAPRCEPARTQQDVGSSIRACLCTRDFCNHIDDPYPGEVFPTTPMPMEENRQRQGFVETFGLLNEPDVICPRLLVSNADYADCNGEYRVVDVKVGWDASRPVYKLINRDRYIFWNAGGLGWSIGKKEYLSSGAHWHRSGLDTDEPWQGIWEEGVKVKCKEKSGSVRGGSGPVNCVWSSFSSWGRCSSSCGKGTQQRVRSVKKPAARGGRGCTGEARQTRSCQSRPCPLDCVWGRFGSWSQCSKKCGGGTRTRRRKKARRERSGGRCEGEAVEKEACNERACPGEGGGGDSCCPKILVSATGGARLDQALYLGIYNKLPTQFNGRASYESEDDDPLYIYFFHSARDRVSLWVIGPQLGRFIAGIRNSRTGQCVDGLGSGWKYASRAGVWEDNDPSLKVECLGGAAPVRRTTTRRPLRATTKAENLFDVIEKVTEKTTTPKPRQQKQDCIWSSYGLWSECSKSCGKGFRIRVRRVLRPATGGGKPCSGGGRERKSCNKKSCSSRTTTTRRPPTTTRRPPTTTRRTTTRRPPITTRRPISITRRPTTRRTTTRRPTTTTTRRSVQLTTSGGRRLSSRPNRVKCYVCGSLFSTDAPDCDGFNKNDPEQQKMCKTDEACLYYSWTISGKTSIIRECFPTTILLGTIDKPVEAAEECNPVPVESSNIRACICTTDLCTGIGDDSSDRQVESGGGRRRPNKPRAKVSAARRSDPDRVRCHQCGSLFSDSNAECKVFDERDPSQSGYCMPGEACLWYSWQKSAGNPSIIRECFSTSILLGTLQNPLESKESCEPQDLSDSSVRACLCHSDMCNAYRELRPASKPGQRGGGNEVQEIPRRNPLSNNDNSRGQFFHPDKIGLQCYACGSLLNRNKKCDQFNRTDSSQVQTCLTDEACLMYSWKKSPTERATLRECFPTRVLLGTIDDPLVPSRECSQRDITDNGKGNIFACLCTTDFCNDDAGQGRRVPPRLTVPSTKASPRKQKFSKTNCPSGFDRVDNDCYFFSVKRASWIEAKKLCEDNKSRLLSLETRKKHDSVMQHFSSSSRRTTEFWLSGNDIDKEQVWEWARGRKRGPVPSFGWQDQPKRSSRENCLSWTVTPSSTAGWQAASCCHNLRYICEL